jgi:rSAM/selenodomain-associated transferase 1
MANAVDSSSQRILVFAKAPIPGCVKTRLLTELSPTEAAKLHMAMVHNTLSMACNSQLAPVELWIDGEHPFFQECKRLYPIQTLKQYGGDIGTRMQHAFNQRLSESDAVLIVGTDCPALAKKHLQSAFAALKGGRDIVLLPVDDGGYVLIAARRIDASLFQNISWGTHRVMVQTRNALSRLGWTWAELDTLWDIDRPQDLQRFRADIMYTRLLSVLEDTEKTQS